jgi:hypothetical protein
MSYLSIAQMHKDNGLRSRVTGCCAQEGASNPDLACEEIMWGVVSEPGWGEAWDSAVAAAREAGPANAVNPGTDPSVIPDAWILTAVQKHLSLLTVEQQPEEVT